MTKIISLQSSIEICISKCSEKNNKRYKLKCEIFYFNPSLLKQYRQESKSNKLALLQCSSKIQRKITSLGRSMLSLMNKDKKFARLIQLLFAKQTHNRRVLKICTIMKRADLYQNSALSLKWRPSRCLSDSLTRAHSELVDNSRLRAEVEQAY